jgi:cytochrome oxidase Cu insertion factor (SCO1/SenC/PrrC family)
VRQAFVTAVVTLLLVAGVATAAPDFAAVQLQPYDSPRPAPPLALPDLDGQTRSLSDLRGKVVLLFFWATW